MPKIGYMLLNDAILCAIWQVAPESIIQWEGECTKELCVDNTIPDSTGLEGSCALVDIGLFWAMREASKS